MIIIIKTGYKRFPDAGQGVPNVSNQKIRLFSYHTFFSQLVDFFLKALMTLKSNLYSKWPCISIVLFWYVLCCSNIYKLIIVVQHWTWIELHYAKFIMLYSSVLQEWISLKETISSDDCRVNKVSSSLNKLHFKMTSLTTHGRFWKRARADQVTCLSTLWSFNSLLAHSLVVSLV